MTSIDERAPITLDYLKGKRRAEKALGFLTSVGTELLASQTLTGAATTVVEHLARFQADLCVIDFRPTSPAGSSSRLAAWYADSVRATRTGAAYRPAGVCPRADRHPAEPDLAWIARHLAQYNDQHVHALEEVAARYPQPDPEPAITHDVTPGGRALLHHLQDLHSQAAWVDLAWHVLGHGAQALRDPNLLALVDSARSDTDRQLRWLRDRAGSAAAQALAVA